MSQLSSAGSLAATLLFLLAAAAAVAAAGSGLPSPLVGAPACQNDIDKLQTTCLQYVQKDGPKVRPSPDCCSSMKALGTAEVPCVREYLGSPPPGRRLAWRRCSTSPSSVASPSPGTAEVPR
uniref:Bifunctional inhibitor/plant lipid transfer protein/seed storage helical domain-containing protein n=1 Tax=Arundo donax TaxID=35708 RepID=A0A0A8ZR63_ARUDO